MARDPAPLVLSLPAGRQGMLRCSDGSIYVGHTDHLEARLNAHERRLYCGYTAKRLPVTLIYAETFNTRDEAFAAERQIKGWSRAKKLALADGDWAEVRRLALRHSLSRKRTALAPLMVREPHHEREGAARDPAPLVLRLSKDE